MTTIDFVIHIGDIVSISLLLQFRLFTFRIVKLDSWTVTCTPCIMNLMMILTRRRGTYKGHFSSEKQFIIFYFEPGVASFRIMVLIPRVRGELKIYAKTYDFLYVYIITTLTSMYLIPMLQNACGSACGPWLISPQY